MGFVKIIGGQSTTSAYAAADQRTRMEGSLQDYSFAKSNSTMTSSNTSLRSDQEKNLIQEARKAAQRAIRESDPESQADRQTSRDGWRNMWIALVIIGATLLFLRLRF